jgi:hypothetical protein
MLRQPSFKGLLAEACGLVCPSAWLGADEPAHRKGLCNRHLCCGPSSLKRCTSFAGDPIVKLPIGTTIISVNRRQRSRRSADRRRSSKCAIFDGWRCHIVWSRSSATPESVSHHSGGGSPYPPEPRTVSAARATPSNSGLSRSETAMNVIQSATANVIMQIWRTAMVAMKISSL